LASLKLAFFRLQPTFVQLGIVDMNSISELLSSIVLQVWRAPSLDFLLMGLVSWMVHSTRHTCEVRAYSRLGIRGYSGWRWLFILEGLLTVVIALAAKPFICDAPADASWLTDEEKRFITLRLQFDGHERGYKEPEFKMKYVKQAFTDSKVYLGCVSHWMIPCDQARAK
jgi:hypothetical protein